MLVNKALLFVTVALVVLFMGLCIALADEPVPGVELGIEGIVVDPEDAPQTPSADHTTNRANAGVPLERPATLAEYTVPVSPTNLLLGTGGGIWFSSYRSEYKGEFWGSIGRLDAGREKVKLYPISKVTRIWGLAEEAEGVVWYTGFTGGTIGRLNSMTDTATEWTVPWHHFGVDLDPSTGSVWFTTYWEGEPGIYRLSPQTDSVVGWATEPYTLPYDLDLDADGNAWFTIQPWDMQGVGRLDPDTDTVTVWKLPIENSRPLRVVSESPDSIWFTEYGASANSVAHLTPSTSILDQYRIPTGSSNPAGLLLAPEGVWYAGRGSDAIGMLDTSLGTPTRTVVTSMSWAAPTVSVPVTATERTLQPETVPATVTHKTAPGTVTGAFVEYRLPDSGHLALPFGIARAPSGRIWYAASGLHLIGALDPPEPYHRAYLPLVTNHATPTVIRQRKQ